MKEWKVGETAWSPFDGWAEITPNEDEYYCLEHGQKMFTKHGLLYSVDQHSSLFDHDPTEVWQEREMIVRGEHDILESVQLVVGKIKGHFIAQLEYEDVTYFNVYKHAKEIEQEVTPEPQKDTILQSLAKELSLDADQVRKAIEGLVKNGK